MTDRYLKRHDTAPPIVTQIVSQSGDPIDLSNASVTFILRGVEETSPKVEASATVDTPTEGIVSYEWADDGSDTDTSGRYHAEWEVTHDDGSVQTHPPDEYESVEIIDDLNDD